MLSDLRFALRMIAQHRWFSAAVIITLALGIGINSTVFSLVNAVLYKPVGLPGGDRLVTVAAQKLDNPAEKSALSWPDFVALRDQNQSFEGLEAVERDQVVIAEPALPPERSSLGRITPNLFELLRTPVVHGRGFTVTDGAAGAAPVVLLSHTLWQKRYGGSIDALNRPIRINGQPAIIVGIMPDGFRFPNNEDLWMPLVPTAALEDPKHHALEGYGLLRPGVRQAAAQADLDVIASRLRTALPADHENIGVAVLTFHEAQNGGPIKAIFLMMLAAVGFVLLIACANVANMMLARAIARGREIAVRVAVGASRAQIIRQLLVESVLLSLLGGLLGFAFSGLGLHAFDLATRHVGRPYWIDFSMDWHATLYFAALTLASGIGFGLVPALRASRVDLTTAIKDGTPGAGSQRGGFTATLVVLQFALTVVLLAGAGAMIRSFFVAQDLNAFARPDSLFTARLQLPEADGERYHEPASRQQFFAQLLPALEALPGVTAVAGANTFPGFGTATRDLEIEGRPAADPAKPWRGSMIVETPNYLATIGLPLLTGRGFDATDGEPGHEVAIVSRTFAQQHWPDTSAIGQRFRFKQDDAFSPWMTIVGVSADMMLDPGAPDTPPAFHVTYRQQSWGYMGVLLRTRSDATALAAPVRLAVQHLDEALPLSEARTLSAGLDQQRWFLKVFGSVFSVFAATGLLMAAVGVYGVIAHHTARRTREIGIRMALGATAGNIARLVLARGLWQLGLGLTLGLAGAMGATHLMANIGILIGINSHDPVLFGGIVVVLLLVGLTACWLPACRAARIAPTEALRRD